MIGLVHSEYALAILVSVVYRHDHSGPGHSLGPRRESAASAKEVYDLGLSFRFHPREGVLERELPGHFVDIAG
jgi:hypothetical protein